MSDQPRDLAAEAENILVQAVIEQRARAAAGPPAPGRCIRYTTGSKYRDWRERQARGEDPYASR